MDHVLRVLAPGPFLNHLLRSWSMSTLSLRLPESLHRQLAALAKSEGISINQLIASAAAEK